MFKLVVLVVLAVLAVQTTLGQIFPNQKKVTVKVENDPYVYSVKKGQQTCSYSSPDWIATFTHPRLLITSTFSDYKTGTQHPTIQKSVRVVFKRPHTWALGINSYWLQQEYTAQNPSYALSNKFDSGVSSVSGWLTITTSWNTVNIYDQLLGIKVTIIRASSFFYNLYVTGPLSFFASGGGLLVDGCPYNAVYPWQAYTPNPNIGRKKRQTSACVTVGRSYQTAFPDQDAFSAANMQAVCDGDSQFITNTTAVMNENLVALRNANAEYDRYFPASFTPIADDQIKI